MEKSMDKIIGKTEQVINVITKSDKYKTYLYLKNKLSSDEEIMNLIDGVKLLQKEIIKETSKGNDVHLLEQKINKNIELLNNNPMYVEFNYIQEDLNEMFQYVKNTIQDNINKILN